MFFNFAPEFTDRLPVVFKPKSNQTHATVYKCKDS